MIDKFDTAQAACPKCKEDENLSDVTEDNSLFSTCHECGYQWYEPWAPRRYR